LGSIVSATKTVAKATIGTLVAAVPLANLPPLVYKCDKPSERTCKSLAHRNMQLVTFLMWINNNLASTGNTINDLSQLSDGNSLPHLAEVICGEIPPNVVLPAATARDKMQNISATIQLFQQKLNASFSSVSVPLILSNNQKAIMDLIWEIIYNYSVKTIFYKGYSDRFALFKWVQENVQDFLSVTVVDFTTSFKDALVICALVSHFAPHLLKFQELQEYKVLDNFRLAFKIADEQFDVPKLLDPKDMANDPDEISVIVYLCLCFYKFV